MHVQQAGPARVLIVGLFVAASLLGSIARADDMVVELPASELQDRIQGGVLGQMLGNLNGLPHEFKYIDQPGDVRNYTPALPEGAHTDDDTDIEWVYIIEAQRSGELFVSPRRAVELWDDHINDWIWAANNYSRQLMDLGLQPPLTGHALLNPWAETNVAGLYMTEMFSLASPAMPETAARLCVHYARTSVDREPLQAAQFFSTVISLAFVEHRIPELIQAGRAAVDPKSEVAEIVDFVQKQWQATPQDWRATRRAIRDRYTRYGGVRPDINGYALNTAAAVATLLYGHGDFVETLRLAFNFGWDADNTAAVCGTVVGVIQGRAWMDRQGWTIKDVYRNTRREGLPTDETITGYGRRVFEVAQLVIKQNDGSFVQSDGKTLVRIRRQPVKNVEPMVSRRQRARQLREAVLPTLEKDLLHGTHVDRARAIYLAIVLGEADELRRRHPGEWRWGVQRLERIAPGLVIALFKAPKPHGDSLRRAAREAGVLQPKE